MEADDDLRARWHAFVVAHPGISRPAPRTLLFMAARVFQLAGLVFGGAGCVAAAMHGSVWALLLAALSFAVAAAVHYWFGVTFGRSLAVTAEGIRIGFDDQRVDVPYAHVERLMRTRWTLRVQYTHEGRVFRHLWFPPLAGVRSVPARWLQAEGGRQHWEPAGYRDGATEAAAKDISLRIAGGIGGRLDGEHQPILVVGLPLVAALQIAGAVVVWGQAPLPASLIVSAVVAFMLGIFVWQWRLVTGPAIVVEEERLRFVPRWGSPEAVPWARVSAVVVAGGVVRVDYVADDGKPRTVRRAVKGAISGLR